MRKVIYILFLCAILALPFSASAQSDVTLDSVLVKLWPEFDQRAVLVIYQIELAADTPLPAAVSVNIPAEGGSPSAVAMIVEDGRLVDADYTVEENGDWTAVNVSAETTGLWVEYYDARLTLDGTKREYEFTWVGSHAVNNLAVELQRPADVLLISSSPALGGGAPGNYGLTYYRGDFGSVAVDEPFDISVSYEKSSDTLSVDTIDTQSSSPVDPADPVSPAFKINWQWLIGFAAAGLIGYGIFTYFGIGRPASSKPRRKRTRAAGKKPQASSAAASVYCHNCGTQAFKGDKFCRECGTKLRV